ncbi:integrin alpha n-terminal [Fusarium langsethiae]|uniref:Integrin alpha n-terminal n=1 Tax=Fusarium langsethiae TaxID=179993 RepID=A0A0M9EQM1_FUSLA|nr:integrin alpha n-terminal [Fusarium langsethiae]GKU06652.1 unnamed protein product [Fusarium langsethiae]
MLYLTAIATALAISCPMVAADWGWPEDAFVVANSGATCNGLILSYSADKAADYCNALVEDGCHGGALALNPGSITFAANKDVDCKEAGPKDTKQCQEAFEHVISNIGRWGGPGATLSAQMYVYNHNGDQAGAIGVVGGCLPINPVGITLY